MDKERAECLQSIFRIIIVSILMLIVFPIGLLFLPICIILKTIATIWQPYFYKKQSKECNKHYQEYRKKGICIDYLPSYGTFWECPLGSKKDYEFIITNLL